MSSCPFAHSESRLTHKPHGESRLTSLTPLTRSGDGIPFGQLVEVGKFGRLFPNLAPLHASDEALTALGVAMQEPESQENEKSHDNPNLPAGFTYLGQFIDHDITFDTTTMPELAVDPRAIHNFRTPKLDLDSLYGTGPASQPYLYERAGGGRLFGALLVGRNPASKDQNNKDVPSMRNDLPRTEHIFDGDTLIEKNGFALIGDPRNDENLLVAQTHLAFLKFHNKVLRKVAEESQGSPGQVFEEARRIVTWHYQWIVLKDFLGRLVMPEILADVLENGRRFYFFDIDAFIPIEFTIAAYRLGHSMVRSQYDHNRIFGPTPPRRAFNAELTTLFAFSGLSGDGVQFPLPFEKRIPLPSNWVIDWRRFYELPRPEEVVGPDGEKLEVPLQLSRKLDPFLTRFLHDLPGIPDEERKRELHRLSVRNLIRGARNGLPSGQAVATKLGVEGLQKDQIATGSDGAVAAAHGFHVKTPLWYYILKEAEILGGGRRLGPVGSRILAEVFVGMLEGDPRSFVSQAPEWKPTLPAAKQEDFTMVDMLTFIDEVNPIGEF